MTAVSSVETMFRSRRLQHCIAALSLLAATAASFFFGYSSAVSPRSAPAVAPAELAVPAGFAEHLGYRPGLEDGRLVNPAGSCSSPIPLPRRFEPACRAHDYGYDLLRHADATGTPVQAGLRARLDADLVADMHRSCTNPLCHVAAEVSRAGLALNTWRQRGAAPRPETGLDLAGSFAARIAETVAGRP